MANSDIIKFRELLISDTGFQEKFSKAAEEYKGEQNEKAVFDNLLMPLAEEYGLSASYEEFIDYIKTLPGGPDGELSDDELSQVAGGKGNGGILCGGIGAGLGLMTERTKDYCVIVSFGYGICLVEGATLE